MRVLIGGIVAVGIIAGIFLRELAIYTEEINPYKKDE